MAIKKQAKRKGIEIGAKLVVDVKGSIRSMIEFRRQIALAKKDLLELSKVLDKVKAKR